MANHRIVAALLITGIIIVLLMGSLNSGNTTAINDKDWKVTDEGILSYALSMPQYNLSGPINDGNTTLSTVQFQSRDMQMAGLLRIPMPAGTGQNSTAKAGRIPGIVLLPGATVTKEREQGLAKYLADLGYATLTLDQRNLGALDTKSDLQLFMRGVEPTEHKMVYDALSGGSRSCGFSLESIPIASSMPERATEAALPSSPALWMRRRGAFWPSAPAAMERMRP